MELNFSGELIYWRGPAPFYFVVVPSPESDEIRDVAAMVTYGWGVIPVAATIGTTSWTTSLFPKEGRYLVPIKNVVRQAEQLELAEIVSVRLTLDLAGELNA